MLPYLHHTHQRVCSSKHTCLPACFKRCWGVLVSCNSGLRPDLYQRTCKRGCKHARTFQLKYSTHFDQPDMSLHVNKRRPDTMRCNRKHLNICKSKRSRILSGANDVSDSSRPTPCAKKVLSLKSSSRRSNPRCMYPHGICAVITNALPKHDIQYCFTHRHWVWTRPKVRINRPRKRPQQKKHTAALWSSKR